MKWGSQIWRGELGEFTVRKKTNRSATKAAFALMQSNGVRGEACKYVLLFTDG